MVPGWETNPGKENFLLAFFKASNLSPWQQDGGVDEPLT